MIEFVTLADGLFYYTSCVLCDGPMCILNEGVSNTANIVSNNCYGFNLIFNLDHFDEIVIDPLSEEVFVGESNNKHSYVDYYYVDIQCKNCNNFGYTIDIFVDLDLQKIIKSNMNELSFCVKHKGLDYYLINNYYSGKSTLGTAYEKLVEIPLIEINKENIVNIFTRLQKLIIYT